MTVHMLLLFYVRFYARPGIYALHLLIDIFYSPKSIAQAYRNRVEKNNSTIDILLDNKTVYITDYTAN